MSRGSNAALRLRRTRAASRGGAKTRIPKAKWLGIRLKMYAFSVVSENECACVRRVAACGVSASLLSA